MWVGWTPARNKLLARHIRQAQPYYEAKELSEKLRQKGLNKVVLYERRLREAKENYARAMTGLNSVSEQVRRPRVFAPLVPRTTTRAGHRGGCEADGD